MRTSLLLALLVLQACAGAAIRRDFKATLDDALADPPPVRARWQPDATMFVAPQVVDRALTIAFGEQIKLATRLEFGPVSVKPKLTLSKLTLGPAAIDCVGCVAVHGEFDAVLRYQAGRFVGARNSSVVFDLSVAFGARQHDGDWLIEALPRSVEHLEIDLDGLPRTVMIIRDSLRGWIEQTLTENLPPIVLARIPAGDGPIRAVRAGWVAGGLSAELLTIAPNPWVAEAPPRVDRGWSARLPQSTLLGLIRRSTFKQGAVFRDVWAEPRELVLNGSVFVLDLRLWNVGSAPWWRDLQISGDLGIEGDRIQLAADEVVQVEASPGAGFVDPLAALAKGMILEAVADAVSAGVPSSFKTAVGDKPLRIRIQSLTAEGDDVLVVGTAVFPKQ